MGLINSNVFSLKRWNCASSSTEVNGRSPSKRKKVLLLGLDGAGKTSLFTELINENKTKVNITHLPQPTTGYNVETIKLRVNCLCHQCYQKITLWDCGGDLSARSLWPYHYANTSLLVWVIDTYDRKRLDLNINLLSEVIKNPLLYRVPVLIVLYKCVLNEEGEEGEEENLLTNLEVGFRFLATLTTSRARTFKWQVINISFDDNDSQKNLRKIRECFRELMDS